MAVMRPTTVASTSTRWEIISICKSLRDFFSVLVCIYVMRRFLGPDVKTIQEEAKTYLGQNLKEEDVRFYLRNQELKRKLLQSIQKKKTEKNIKKKKNALNTLKKLEENSGASKKTWKNTVKSVAAPVILAGKIGMIPVRGAGYVGRGLAKSYKPLGAAALLGLAGYKGYRGHQGLYNAYPARMSALVATPQHYLGRAINNPLTNLAGSGIRVIRGQPPREKTSYEILRNVSTAKNQAKAYMQLTNDQKSEYNALVAKIHPFITPNGKLNLSGNRVNKVIDNVNKYGGEYYPMKAIRSQRLQLKRFGQNKKPIFKRTLHHTSTPMKNVKAVNPHGVLINANKVSMKKLKQILKERIPKESKRKSWFASYDPIFNDALVGNNNKKKKNRVTSMIEALDKVPTSPSKFLSSNLLKQVMLGVQFYEQVKASYKSNNREKAIENLDSLERTIFYLEGSKDKMDNAGKRYKVDIGMEILKGLRDDLKSFLPEDIFEETKKLRQQEKLYGSRTS